MIVPVSDQQPPAHLREIPHDDADLRDAIGKIIASTVSRITADSAMRKANYQKKPSLLNKGIWYSNDYYTALKETKNFQRLEWLKKRHAFYHGFIPGKLFSLRESPLSPSGKCVQTFDLRKEVKPSEALTQLGQNFCLLDCANVYQIGIYTALYQIWGQEKFDTFFSDTRYRMSIGGLGDRGNPLATLCVARPSSTTLLVGQRAVFNNHQFYRTKHLEGDTGSFNVVVLEGGTTFTGFGLPAEGCTEEQMDQLMIATYNQSPIPAEEIYTPELADRIKMSSPPLWIHMSEKLRNHQLDLKEYKTRGGGFLPGETIDVKIPFVRKILETEATTIVNLKF